MAIRSLLFVLLFLTVTKAQQMPVSVNVGLLLNLDKDNDTQSSIRLAMADFYNKNSNYTTRIDLHLLDAKDGVVDAAAAAINLIQNDDVRAILGPSTSQQASFVAKLGEKYEVPIITFAATNPALTSVRSTYFFRATQNDSTQTGAISALMKVFNWREAAVIYDDNEFGMGILSYLADSLIAVDSRISWRSPIPLNASDDRIEKELLKISGLQTRVIIVHMLPTSSSGTRVFQMAKKMGLMREGYAWLLTDSVTNLLYSADPLVQKSMSGALGVKPYIASFQELEDFQRRWERENPGLKQSVFALYGCDAVVALAIAIEQMGSEIVRNQISRRTDSCLNASPVSENGARLLEELSKVKFKGFTGDFSFVDGQLPEAAYTIVNIDQSTTREVGFWTRQNGLSKEANEMPNSSETTPKNLKPIIWPGEITSPPKGWGTPINGKKLRFAVPDKGNYSEFLTFIKDNSTGIEKEYPTGFCIDLFEELIKILPYSLEPSYIRLPFNTKYDEMVQRVHEKEFDGAVADITILANRSKYVDFTHPYTDSWVFIVVKARPEKTADKWLFVKPMETKLWFTIIAFFIFIGFVVWVLEHRVNKSFRGPPSNQIGASLLFAFSTMVFAHREKVISNLTRIVIVVWCFVTLVVVQSYTASLTSLLTVEVIEPTEITVDKLISERSIVSVSEHSFLRETLRQLGFNDNSIKSFIDYDQCHEQFQNGIISAAFMEGPYLKPFFSKHCNAYTSKQAFVTGGFGFVFQRGSPLVSDMSRAILEVATNDQNVTKNNTMNLIERKWFTSKKCDDDENSKIKSTKLELRNFQGLFIIAGVVCLLALVIFAINFYMDNRKLLSYSDPGDSHVSRFRRVLTVYDSPATDRYPFRATMATSPLSFRNHKDNPNIL